MTPICAARDDDGLDVYFLNYRSGAPETLDGKAAGRYYNIREADEVTRIFETTTPRGRTPMGKRLEEILGAYMGRLEKSDG